MTEWTEEYQRNMFAHAAAVATAHRKARDIKLGVEALKDLYVSGQITLSAFEKRIADVLEAEWQQYWQRS